MEDTSFTRRMQVVNSSVIQFYSAATPNGIKVAAALEEICEQTSLKAEFMYEPHTVNIRAGETRSEYFRGIAPHGKIPAIVDTAGPDGKEVKVFESGAILVYLAEKYKLLLPTDDIALRNLTLSWLFWGSTAVSSQFKLFGFYYKYCSHKLPYCITRYSKECLRLLVVLETHLSDGKHFINGEYYSIADIAIWPWVYALHENYDDAVHAVFNDCKQFPNIIAWYNRCLRRPSSQRGLEVTPFVFEK